jgi:hypothetical protein
MLQPQDLTRLNPENESANGMPDGRAGLESCRSHPARRAATNKISIEPYLIMIKDSDSFPVALCGFYSGYNSY